MHPDELQIDVAQARRLLVAQFPQWAALPLEAVEPSGTDNATYRLGDRLALRLPRMERSVAALEKELAWLPLLADRLPLAVPVPVAVGERREAFPWPSAVYTWLEGETALVADVDLGRAAVDLARFVTALQAIDPAGGPPPGEHNVFRGEPLEARDAAVRASIAALRDELDVDAVTAAWDEALRAPPWRRPPVWVHGDLDRRNLLVTKGRIGAVIDFGCLGVGDPACDVMVAWKVLTAETREAFRKELSVDDATWARARGWALSQALNALSYDTLETNAALVGEARRWLAEVLADRTRSPATALLTVSIGVSDEALTRRR